MITINNMKVDINNFPDGSLLLKENINESENRTVINWYYENNEELVVLYFLTKHIRSKGIKDIELKMPYIPNARQDRVKNGEDVFTLKYFSEMINDLMFSKVRVLDPHSYVSEALIERIDIETPCKYVEKVIKQIGDEDIVVFYPDEGAMKRYSAMFDYPYAFGIKKRDWATGVIKGLDVAGQTDLIRGRKILIIDDICSKGGTFYYSAKALKELGADEIYLYISHCENTVLKGNIIDGDLIKKIYTTNSIFTENNEKVEVFDYE